MTRLVIVSGLSGSGKSVALHTLEDLGWFCIDNLPAGLVRTLVAHTFGEPEPTYRRLAIGLDARNRPGDLAGLPALLSELSRSGLGCEVLYLNADDATLLRRYAETRRRHPLAADGVSLAEAIAAERSLLQPLADLADLTIDTSLMSVHALRELVRQRVEERHAGRLSILFESFGYKHGIPGDADFVFDARTLPNPYWEPALRDLTGQDQPVRRFLESSPQVARMLDEMVRFLEARIDDCERLHRGYLTVAVGCTGGRHRSVYLVDQLAGHFTGRHPTVLARHTTLQKPG